MKRRADLAPSHLTLLVALSIAAAAAILPPSVAGQPAAMPADPFHRTYQINHLDVRLAEVLAWEQCRPDAGDRCRVVHAGEAEGMVTIGVLADAETHERIVRALAANDVVPYTQIFQVVLVAAGKSGPAGTSDLPKAAAEAVADLANLLPFTSYRLIDSTWVRTTDTAEAKLSGDGHYFRMALKFRGQGGIEGAKLLVEVFRLGRYLGQSAPQGIGPVEDLINTSFGLEVGETVVVGTSKLNGGDEALIALVTAVP